MKHQFQTERLAQWKITKYTGPKIWSRAYAAHVSGKVCVQFENTAIISVQCFVFFIATVTITIVSRLSTETH